MITLQECKLYIRLYRLDKPIGILLLLWPTLWALWLSANGSPNTQIVMIFILGVVVMRSGGCALNDLADYRFDGKVFRTKNRPLANGELRLWQVLNAAMLMFSCAFILVLNFNELTLKYAIVGAYIAVIYPLLKRVTHLPQLGLGAAFSWGVPMAFAAQLNYVPSAAWFLFSTCLIWPVIYDTMYAMVDRDDDIKIGVKSTAILFNKFDILIIGALQILFVLMLVVTGIIFHLQLPYYLSLLVVIALFIYQIFLLRTRKHDNYFKAFLNNHWVGFVIFVGILLSYYQ